MRDDFTQATKETLAKRVGCRCSNPGCRKLTSGPHEEAHKSINIGVAAHITAAAPGGKRYDASLSSEQRKSIENGIWLCQNCGKLVDSDEQKYSVELLVNWKHDAEDRAALEVESAHQSVTDGSSAVFRNYLTSLVSEPQKWWLDEINDLTWVEFPLSSITKEKPKNPDEQPKNTPPQLVLDAIKGYVKEKILIVGPPGAGKSTLLETICKQAAARAIEDASAPIPILVELRDYKAGEGFRGLILQNLESHDPSLDDENLKKLLQERRLLLLVDGLNEKSEAQRDLTAFCRNIPLIATSRQEGDGWGIERKLELQPLAEKQVRDFFELRLPDADRAHVQALGDRVKDFGQTPLMVWMLYSIFRANKDVPETRGEAYRSFTTLYAERAKDGIDLSDARSLLGKLAFEMMRSPSDDPTDFRLKISEVEAQNILGSEATLKRMLNHLLKQQGKPGNREISFCHQSLQEYYAAEWLLVRVKMLEDAMLQQEFLNYLKWTEPVALMLALLEDVDWAVRVVDWALDVDLMLGARLAGEVRSDFQESTIQNINDCLISKEIPDWLKIDIFGETKSINAIPLLLKILNNDPSVLPHHIADILDCGGADKYPFLQLIKALEEGSSACLEAAEILNMNWRQKQMLKPVDKVEFDKIEKEAVAFNKMIEFPQENHPKIPALELLSKLESGEIQERRDAASKLGKFNNENVASGLLKAFNDNDSQVRLKASSALAEIQSDQIIPFLLEMMNPKNYAQELFETIIGLNGGIDPVCVHACELAAKTLGKMHSEQSILALIRIVENRKHHYYARKCSVEALGISHLEIAIPVLIQSLNDKHVDIRKKSARALGFIASEQAIQELLLVLEDEDVSSEAAWALVQIGSEKGLPGILYALGNFCLKGNSWEDSSSSSGACEAARVLGKIAVEKAIPNLLEALNNSLENEDFQLYWCVLGALMNYKGERVSHALPHLLKHISTDTGQCAFQAIQSIQAKCKFYNYDIEKQAEELRKADRASPKGCEGDRYPNIIVKGDYIAGDKIQGDKIGRDKYHIDRVGNLNTGTVNIHGNQNGEQ
jgi:HEAT repeat protein